MTLRLHLSSFRQPFVLGMLLALLSAPLCAVEDKDSLFPDLVGWTKGTTASWGPDNLYEPIDGAADLFLRYGFEQMRSMEYRNETGDTVSVEAYRHASPINAFGIYSQGRPVRDAYLEIGVQAYGEPDSLTVLAGRHYLELRSSSDSDVCRKTMNDLARRMAAALNDGARFPEFFSHFPKKGRKPCSEKYISKDILGYAFLEKAFQVDYEIQGQVASLFAFRADSEKEVAAMTASYLAEAKLPADTPLSSVAEVSDKYHGKVLLHRSGSFLLLCSGKASIPERKALLLALKASIEQRTKVSP